MYMSQQSNNVYQQTEEQAGREITVKSEIGAVV